MTTTRQKILICLFLIAMLVFAVLSLLHTRHQGTFRLIYFCMMCINAYLAYRQGLKRRQPDTLIHLFPENAEPKKALTS